jgi:uncharacterized protein YlxW (UPF0749 family)
MRKIEETPEKTGYKIADALLYVFHYLFKEARTDIRAFIIIALIFLAATGWGLFVREAAKADERVEKARTEERALCKEEIAALRGDIESLKTGHIALENELKANAKESNKALTELYERIIKNKK